MSIKWSFSTERCFRKCQRLYFFREIAASPKAKDPLRHEAYIRKQLKTVEQWRGLVVHRGIELFVVPSLKERGAVDWGKAVDGTTSLAKRQLVFSAARRYRDPGMTKTAAGDDYAALLADDMGEGMPAGDAEDATDIIRQSILWLSEMRDFWDRVPRRGQLWAELPIHVTYDGARIKVQLDLLFFQADGRPSIVDWKVYDGVSGSDGLLQTSLYAWALCRSGKWRVTNIADCELVEAQLLRGEVLCYHPTVEQSKELEDRIYRSLCEMRPLHAETKFNIRNIDEYDFAQNPNSCAYCVYRSMCREVGREAKEPFQEVQTMLF